ncbi:proteasome subunit beta type-2-like [Maniola hyperantus]|uniref:proteasome subunit beta type-2-like n=1 Tax=Aphantopus hyperantus TaxID=2795564 RepID=UPI00374A7B0C
MSEKLVIQCLFGMQCRDFVMIAADRMNTQSVLIMQDDMDKLYKMSDNMVLGLNGDVGDMNQFEQFITSNLGLYKLRNNYQLETPAVAHFIRKNLSDMLCTANPYYLNLLVAGYDEQSGPQLYTMDWLASCHKIRFAAHGLGGMLALSIMDRYYNLELTQPEAHEVMLMCVREMQQRLLINLPNFRVKTVSKHGVRTLPDINSAMLSQKNKH